MDDKEQQPASEGAQEARDKGAALEYDAEDETALDSSTPTSDRKDASQREEK